MNFDSRFLVCLYSDPSFIAVNILENLLSNNCFVNIISDNPSGWIKTTSHISSKNKFSINDKSVLKNKVNYGYAIFSYGFIDTINLQNEAIKFSKYFENQNTKILFVLPRETYGEFKQEELKGLSNPGFIYVGDLLGPRIDLKSNLTISKHINEIINKNRFSVAIGEVFYPLFVSDAAKQIVRWLFAFGPYGKTTFLLGPQTPPNYIWQECGNFISNLEFVTDTKRKYFKLPEYIEATRFTKDLGFMLGETFKWINMRPVENIIKSIPVKKITIPRKNKIEKSGKLKILFLALLVIFIMPLFTTIIGGGLSYLSLHQFKKGREGAFSVLIKTSKIVSLVGYYESKYFKHIPIIGSLYKETEYASFAIIKISDIGSGALPLLSRGGDLIKNILEGSPYSLVQAIDVFENNLREMYNDVFFLEQETQISKNKGSYLAGKALSKFNFEMYKNLISRFGVIVQELPEVLGDEQSKTYLVLFQNNMELRPTGGFIGSFGLLTFNKGRLSDFTISDVYSADGQLNGHVDPPEPIRKYLNEANWWLRDSNWDPDFPTSAKRAEWFLDKEIDQEVDGVISVDLNPIKDFLKISGPIYLSDYNLDIDYNNLYEKVQSEVEEKFFPGTHKKASFLTALSRNILNKTGSLNSPQKISLLELIFNNLNERHLQVFLHNENFQNSIKNLAWDGSVSIPVCGNNCYSDFVGVVEANVGDNKSNLFINRDLNMIINISQDELNRTLTLTLQNSANTSLGLSGRYKSYIRLIVPELSTNISVKSIFGQTTQDLLPEITTPRGYKEIGVILEILAGETKKIVFSWSGDLNKNIDFYNLYVRKQAGIDELPLSVKVNTPLKILGSSPAFSLTGEGNYLYNTTLTRDLTARLSL